MAQACTLLEEVALVAMEVPSRWVFSINQEFLELKSFLCAQMIDEARHVEASRKRALVSGQGLGRASVSAEQALKELLSAETYPEASLATNLLLGSFVLAMYRALAAVSRARADRLLATLSMQDVARSVAYGVAHMRYHLGHQPGKAVALGDYLDRSEHTVLGIAGTPEFLEPLVLLAAGSRAPAALARGAAFARRWLAGALGVYRGRRRGAQAAPHREAARTDGHGGARDRASARRRGPARPDGADTALERGGARHPGPSARPRPAARPLHQPALRAVAAPLARRPERGRRRHHPAHWRPQLRPGALAHGTGGGPRLVPGGTGGYLQDRGQLRGRARARGERCARGGERFALDRGPVGPDRRGGRRRPAGGRSRSRLRLRRTCPRAHPDPASRGGTDRARGAAGLRAARPPR